jgi:beta-mannosidase
LDIGGEASSRLTGTFTFKGQGNAHTVKVRLENTHGQVVREGEVRVSDGLSWDFAAGEVDVWWPIGYGSQPLYTMLLELLDAVSPAI